MKYRQFIAESESPKPSYSRTDFDGLRFFRSVFPKGSWQVYSYPAQVRYCDAPTCHIQTIGVVGELSGAWPDHEPGWLSRRDSFVIQPGTYTRVAKTDAERWCCLGTSGESGAERVDTISLPAGSFIEIDPGVSVFPVSGALKCGELVCNSGLRLRCGPEPRVVQAVSDVLAFMWPHRA